MPLLELFRRIKVRIFTSDQMMIKAAIAQLANPLLEIEGLFCHVFAKKQVSNVVDIVVIDLLRP